MSNQQKMTHDPVPIIETVEDSENEDDEVLPSTPGQEHIDLSTPEQDSASLLSSVFNTNQQIINTPLPIESAALSSFHINSPVHNFPVSVPDCLPDNVMEMDSPTPEDDLDISENDDFNLENLDLQILNKNKPKNGVEDSFVNLPKNSRPSGEDDILGVQEFQNKYIDGGMATQTDLFASETASQIHKESIRESVSPCGQSLEEFSELHQSVVRPAVDELSLKRPLLESPIGISPSKRKREFFENFKAKVPKTDSEDSDDSDIEILTEKKNLSSSVQDHSIEVVYDNKKNSSFDGVLDSQDINLVLTAESQSQISPSVSQKKVERQSNLLDSSLPAENFEINQTMRATQVEMICNSSSTNLSSTPEQDIQPLLTYPIISNAGPTASESTNPLNIAKILTPGVSESQYIENVISPSNRDDKDSIVDSSQSQIETISPSLQDISAVRIPHFDTPQDPSPPLNHEESVFVKAKRAADGQLLKEKKISEQNILENSDSYSPDNIINLTTDELNKTDFSNSAMNDSLQIIGESSQTTIKPNTSASFFFSQSNRNVEDNISPKTTYVHDSDDEVENKIDKPPLKTLVDRKKLEMKKTSTPNSSDVTSPNLSEDGQSYIKNKDTPSDSSKAEENKEETPNQGKEEHSASTENTIIISPDHELRKEGYIRHGVATVVVTSITRWLDPKTGNETYTYKSLNDNDVVLKDDTPFKEVCTILTKVQSESSLGSTSSSRRISDVSSISRFSGMTHSLGYLGDKSSSSSGPPSRHESTRYSMDSVIPLESSPKDYSGFVLPNKVPPRRATPKTVDMGTQTDSTSDDESMTKDRQDTPISSVKKSRGGRGRGRGRGGSTRKKQLKFDKIDEKEEFITSTSLSSSDAVDETAFKNESSSIIKSTTIVETHNVFNGDAIQPFIKGAKIKSFDLSKDEIFCSLSEETKKILKNVQIILTEDEEEMFLKHTYIPETSKIIQCEEISRKVLETKIEGNLLVFARYVDDSYYSAVVTKKGESDKWEVEYILDERVNVVRERHILPTSILPVGILCHVRHPDQIYYDLGRIVGHVRGEDDILLHIIELSSSSNQGTTVRVPLSHIKLKSIVADSLLKNRRQFFALTPSPGANLSLDNVVVGKRRREESTNSPSAKRAILSSPALKKFAESRIDTFIPDAEHHESTKKASKKYTPVRKKVKSTSESSSTEYEPIVSTSNKKPGTPKATPKSALKPKTPKSSARKTNKKSTEEDSPKTSDESMKDINPVVELTQLLPEEDTVTPSKYTGKKRGRKPSKDDIAGIVALLFLIMFLVY